MNIETAVDKINRGIYIGSSAINRLGGLEVNSSYLTTTDFIRVLAGFHPTWKGSTTTESLHASTELAGIVSENVVVEIGFSEDLYGIIGGCKVYSTIALVTSNERGVRLTTMWELPIIDMTLRLYR